GEGQVDHEHPRASGVPEPQPKKGGLEEIPDLGVPHVVFLGLVDSVGDPGSDGVPAQLRGVGGVEVVLGVLAGAAVVLDDVLVLVADDDSEIAVLLHPSLPDSLDSAAPPVTVEGNDTVDCVGGEPAGGPEVSRPLIDRCHK
ncbi:MAG: hypothetical protein ACI9CA_000241, partial [Natronomonas sp.]